MEIISAKAEPKVLLTGLQPESESRSIEKLRSALAQVTDLNYLLQVALNQGVFPSLYRRLADNCPEAVPPEFLTRLKSHYQALARRNLRVAAELLQVLALLESHGIVAVPFKGPVLAAVAYGEITLRQFVDLDILVSRRDIGRVRDLLVGKGYRMRYSF
jgi:hypothetical protein